MMLKSDFQSHRIQINYFKINHITSFNPNSTEGKSEILKPITRNVLSYAQDFNSKVLSPSNKIEDFKIYPVNSLNPTST